MERAISWFSWRPQSVEVKPLPKPWGLPILGNLIQLGPKPHLGLTELGKTFGAVYGLQLGSWDTVVINSLSAAREALVEKGDHFANRPPGWRSLQLHESHVYSVAFADYGTLQVQRKKAILRVLGHALLANVEAFNTILQEEIALMNKKLFQSGENPVDPRGIVKLSSTRVQFRMTFGDPCTKKIEKELMELSSKATDFQKNAGLAMMGDFMPWMRFAVGRSMEGLEASVKSLIDFVRKIYRERQAKYETDKSESCSASAITRRVSTFLNPSKSHMVENEKNTKQEIENQIVMTIAADVFGGGIENISAAMEWMVAHVASHEELQEDLHNELIGEVGVDRMVTLLDKNKMPLMQATVLEALRMSSALPHYCTKDSTIKGYSVKKGSLVLLNLWGINHDATYFCRPYSFQPYRFLDLQGQLRGDRCSTVITFGNGRRSCPGNTVTKNIMFLLMAGILQKFKLIPMQDASTIPTISGLTQFPDAYKVTFVPWERSAESRQ